MPLAISVNVGELGTDHEVAVKSVTTTVDDGTITVRSDVFDHIIIGAVKWAAAAGESDSCHCNGHSIAHLVSSLACKNNKVGPSPKQWQNDIPHQW